MNKTLMLATFCLSTSAFAAKWDKANNPIYFNILAKSPFTLSFQQMPTEAKLRDERLGWSESFWPSNKGGIAYRWNHPQADLPKKGNSFQTTHLHTKDEIKKMSEEQLSQLSPSELYDIAQGDYKYSLTRKVLSKYSPDDLWWEGICHGWALAASNYPEPDKVVVTNKDGIRVPFGSSDVKGLLAMHDAFNSKGTYARIGDRCAVVGKVEGEAFPEDGIVPVPTKKDANRPECADVNAGAFHVVLTNMIGINSQGFVADVDRFNDVWNQPVTGYESKVVGEVKLLPSDLAGGVARKIQVKTVMIYGDELEFYSKELEHEGVVGFVSKDPVTGTPMQTNSEKNYEYILELDARGNVIGGEWISETRPDMLWMKSRDQKFGNGNFVLGLPLEGLNRIYRPVSRR